MSALRARTLRGRYWLVPILFLVLGLAVTFVLWRGLVRERRDQFRSLMDTAAVDGRRAAHAHVEGQLRALRSLAGLWARFGQRPLEAWRADAELMLGQVPGLRRLAWVDTSSDEVWIAAGEGLAGLHRVTPGERAEMQELLGEARRSERPRMEGPFPLGDGSAYRVYVPVQREEGGRGVLAATVDVEAALAPVFAGELSRFAVTVEWNGVPIFRRGEPSTEPLPWWEGAVSELALSMGPVWQVRHQPTARVHDAVLTPLPNYLLYAGLFASFLLAALAHEMQLARDRARALAASYRDLDARMVETQEAQRALRDLNAELEHRVAIRTSELNEAVAELQSFNASVSHDLRSPLGAIQNLTSILQEDCLDALGESELELLDRVQASAGRAIEMMDGLLELSRMGRAELELRPTSMQALAREAFEEAAAAEGAEVRFDLDPLPEARVDPAMMRVVWMNLLRNALKYSRDREKPHIRVGARSREDALVYRVQDNGVGFDMRFAGKLFRVFERLHSREDFEGSGVGLAVVSRVVGRHGGRVWAESEPGQGATFFFSVPHPAGGTQAGDTDGEARTS